ncbi:GNAT family N-acetyltransferase [Streptomyces sp. RPT161]|uniref:GNAT family N-acetyltransferase n=1 Tax=Streptomyces sp. RPT161 TaxID=3015993 RepID=UPI0022B9108C|nr:GNAT family N-acetyltransferase [Streptomyces sp. RPT161]
MTNHTEAQIRPGTRADLEQLTAIYNHYVLQTHSTFDTVASTAEQRQPWLAAHPGHGPHRLFVAEGGGRVLGYATSSRFRARPAYRTSVETAVYCAPDAGGRGIGTLLYTALFEALADQDLHRAYAGIALPNEASVRLHTRFGFRQCGLYTESGHKFGRYWDVARFERPL